MNVTLKDVAELAGVSRSAVSRTYTEGASVSDKTRRKVERAATTLGYYPNALASSLTTGRTKLIGLISNNFHNPLFLEVFDLFTKGLQSRGLRPLLVNLSDDDTPETAVSMLRQYSVDGVILASSTLPLEYARAFVSANIPVVHSFGRQTSAPSVHVVGIDNVACGRMAADALIAKGYQKIGFMGGPSSATSTQDRFSGFSQAANAHTNVQFTHSYASDYTFEAGRAEMAKLLWQEPAEAYFCGDDILSIGALSAIQAAGLTVPDEIGLIGLNDMEIARWDNINLTTIHQPVRQIIESSIELVVSMLDDPNRYPEARIFPCHIVERGTLRG
ncbi:MAG: substrate-binding domain-containing protein [Boseongicola sp.]|nr:MAG: substrate-binding domain-containing protein [Boseongicola sp.]